MYRHAEAVVVVGFGFAGGEQVLSRSRCCCFDVVVVVVVVGSMPPWGGSGRSNLVSKVKSAKAHCQKDKETAIL
jgi:tRNA U34 5-carboxymethylaminomethyl modifying enzyme MnmG/GidA